MVADVVVHHVDAASGTLFLVVRVVVRGAHHVAGFVDDGVSIDALPVHAGAIGVIGVVAVIGIDQIVPTGEENARHRGGVFVRGGIRGGCVVPPNAVVVFPLWSEVVGDVDHFDAINESVSIRIVISRIEGFAINHGLIGREILNGFLRENSCKGIRIGRFEGVGRRTVTFAVFVNGGYGASDIQLAERGLFVIRMERFPRSGVGDFAIGARFLGFVVFRKESFPKHFSGSFSAGSGLRLIDVRAGDIHGAKAGVFEFDRNN